MPVPSPRNSIRIARGNYSDLNANVSALGEGELVYALDQDKFYTVETGVLTEAGTGSISSRSIDFLSDVDTTTAAPTSGQVLKWDGSNWTPADDSNTDAVTSVASKTGDVTLVKSDITDFSDADYATATQGDTADSALQPGDIGVTVQGYDADTAKTDVVQSFTAAQRGTSVTLTSGATVTPDFATGNNFDLTLGVNATLANPSNLTAGQSGVIVITNGAYTLAFGSYWKFPGGTAPTITQSAVSVIAYYVESATRITAQAILNVS